MLGVSPDSVKKHVKFKDKYDLPFTLLADPEHELAERYGVWGEKKYMGKSYMGINRTTFVIGADGAVVKVLENVKPLTRMRTTSSRRSARSRPSQQRRLLRRYGAMFAWLLSLFGLRSRRADDGPIDEKAAYATATATAPARSSASSRCPSPSPSRARRDGRSDRRVPAARIRAEARRAQEALTLASDVCYADERT